MEKRKAEEASFHNTLRKNGIDIGPIDTGQYGYKKWYSIDRKSKDYVVNTIKKQGVGKVVLDYCCGSGNWAIEAAELGASESYGIDISEESIRNAIYTSSERGVSRKTNFIVMDAEELSFGEDYFDLILCLGVLHHLNIERAYSELSRILKPDGMVLVNEPIAYNPFIQLYRQLTPRMRTPWEKKHILKKKEVGLAGRYFHNVEIVGFYHLFSIPVALLRRTRYFDWALSCSESIDEHLLELPVIRWLAWQIIYVLSDPKTNPF